MDDEKMGQSTANSVNFKMVITSELFDGFL